MPKYSCYEEKYVSRDDLKKNSEIVSIGSLFGQQ